MRKRRNGIVRQRLHLSLATRFALASGAVLTVACVAVGTYVTRRIEDSVVRNTAIATALYMESFISPISQQLAVGDALSANGRRALEEIFTNTPLGERVVSYKIWKPGGRVVEASDKTLIGRSFAPGASLKAAWAGEVSATFDELGDEEDAGESALGLPLLEIYSPIREVWSGEVIAVAEFYETNPQLKQDLGEARRAAWLITAAVVAGVGAVLYLIVLGGSRTIERQRRDLANQFCDLKDLSARNAALRSRVQQAAARAAASTEHTLRRIGADLHDGPAQYLAFASLRLDDLRDRQSTDVARAEIDGIGDALTQALSEVRAISRGLGLPDLSGRSACEIARLAVEAHRSRTREEVALTCDCPVAFPLDPAHRICLFRFIQEGLNNASRHAGGAGLEVALNCVDKWLTLAVRDQGPGFNVAAPVEGLGLAGLRDRVESLGGTFAASSRNGGGSVLTMQFETGGA